MHQRFHGLASMATTCRAFSTKLQLQIAHILEGQTSIPDATEA